MLLLVVVNLSKASNILASMAGKQTNTAFSYEQPANYQQQQQAANDGDYDDDQNRSSLQKTIGNVMNLLNDGLYRIKNRTKSE